MPPLYSVIVNDEIKPNIDEKLNAGKIFLWTLKYCRLRRFKIPKLKSTNGIISIIPNTK
jgi:hypothetical protein